MSAPLNKSLLDSEVEGKAVPLRYRRIVVASAAIAVLLPSASFIGYSVGKAPAKLDKFAAVSDDMLRNYTELEAWSKEESCYPYTGGGCETWHPGCSSVTLCMTSTCYSFTGSKCDMRPLGATSTRKQCAGYNAHCVTSECACDSGCAGADGICYNEKNTKLNKQPLLITSSAYPGYYIWFFPWDHGEYFNLYKLPGGGYKGHKLYLLTLDYYPTWLAAMEPSPKPRTELADYGLFGEEFATKKPDLHLRDFAVRVCSVQKSADGQVVKIGRTLENGQVRWATSTMASWLVVGKENGDTSHSHWVLSERDLVEELEDCES